MHSLGSTSLLTEKLINQDPKTYLNLIINAEVTILSKGVKNDPQNHQRVPGMRQQEYLS